MGRCCVGVGSYDATGAGVDGAVLPPMPLVLWAAAYLLGICCVCRGGLWGWYYNT